MVKEETGLVRFLVTERVKYKGLAIDPWVLYRLPLDLVGKMGIEFEVVPSSGRMRVGTRLAQMIQTVGLRPTAAGCCSGCLGIQGTLDAASPDWTRKHIKELVNMIHENAGKQDVWVPKRVIQGALVLAVLLERRKNREWRKRLFGGA